MAGRAVDHGIERAVDELRSKRVEFVSPISDEVWPVDPFEIRGRRDRPLRAEAPESSERVRGHLARSRSHDGRRAGAGRTAVAVIDHL
jgi:hypothetical protein